MSSVEREWKEILKWLDSITLKSMPTVAMKLQLRNVSSLKRTNKQVFPTPESPINIILTIKFIQTLNI